MGSVSERAGNVVFYILMLFEIWDKFKCLERGKKYKKTTDQDKIKKQAATTRSQTAPRGSPRTKMSQVWTVSDNEVTRGPQRDDGLPVFIEVYGTLPGCCVSEMKKGIAADRRTCAANITFSRCHLRSCQSLRVREPISWTHRRILLLRIFLQVTLRCFTQYLVIKRKREGKEKTLRWLTTICCLENFSVFYRLLYDSS